MRYALALVFCCGLAFAQEKKPAPTKAPKMEDCLRRAVIKANKQEGQTVLRVTVCPNSESDTLCAVVEYATGDLAIFVGDDDPANDAWALLDQRNSDIFYEAVSRSRVVRGH